MQYIFIGVAILLLGGAYYLFTSSQTPASDEDTLSESETASQTQDDEVPEGMHRMPDGTLMSNDAMEVTADANTSMEAMDSSAVMEADTSASMEMDEEGAMKTFTVSGVNFEFDVTEIRVNEGDTVTINFTSEDGFHDWVVDEFDAATERVNTGGNTSVTFVADAAGTYEYYCSVGSHRQMGMVGTLIVE